MSSKEYGVIRQGSRSYVVKSTNESVNNTSNTVNFVDAQGDPIILKSIYVGVTGDIKLELEGDTSSTGRYNVPVGNHNFGRIKRIDATGTDADEIVGQYDSEN